MMRSVRSVSGSGCCTVDAFTLLASCARHSSCSATVPALGTSTSYSGGSSPGATVGLVGAVTDGVDALALFALLLFEHLLNARAKVISQHV